ncbi:MAG: hypothetical protein M3042_03045 [Actinomycetota bacterium]|nr:hypothetical protein [Actinomycetota bacterium]
MRRYLIILIATATVAVVVAAGWAYHVAHIPRLYEPGDGSASIAYPTTLKSYSFGTGPLCLNRPGVATVIKVEAQHPDGLRVTDFALAQFSSFGAGPLPLKQSGFGSDRRITGVCKDQHGKELAVRVTRNSLASAGLASLLVTYRSGGMTRTTQVRFGISLCAPSKVVAQGCAA